MKRFWLVLLSLGLIVAFSTSAMAVDVKISGEYYAAGMYLDKTGVTKSTNSGNPSTAFYFQRLRLGAQFVVSPGLSLITRADIMQRAWGAARTAPGAARDIDSAATRAENENIGFDLLYVSYASPIGLFGVGYQIDGAWGTVFGDSAAPFAKITYVLPLGGFALGLQIGKGNDGERSRGTFGGSVANAADRDDNFYTAFVRYAWKAGDAGLLAKHYRNAGNRAAMAAPITPSPDLGFQTNMTAVVPYVKAKFGPVAVQAEMTYLFGKTRKYDGIGAGLVGAQDIDLSSYSGWIDALGDFGMFYVGATVAHVSGDDFSSTDKQEGGVLSGGTDWNPCLIMFNFDRNYWAGNIAGYGATANAAPMGNAWFGQLRAGVRPIDKLDIMMSVAYATADKTPAAVWGSREYGTEIDLTATYKITNNLTYMLGGGYWLVGKYYQAATTTSNDLQDDLLLINKLTLTF